MPDYDLIAILGSTTSGKTLFTIALAYELNTEIISADFRQIHRGMNLGTRKDLADYTANGRTIPYHLINIADSGYEYDAFEYQRDFLNSYESIRQKSYLPVSCGGTGMYLEPVLKGHKLTPAPENPELCSRLANRSLEESTEMLSQYKVLHDSTDVDTVKRAIHAVEIEEYYAVHPVPERESPEPGGLIIGVDIDRGMRREKITRRLKQRLDEGMMDEVRRLVEQRITPDDLIYYRPEYKYLTLHVVSKLTYAGTFNGLEIAIHQFARRQIAWFRGIERRRLTIHQMNAELPTGEKMAFVKEKLQGN